MAAGTQRAQRTQRKLHISGTSVSNDEPQNPLRPLCPPRSVSAGRPPMLVKICGITRLEDATAAVNAGANAVGFVFWPGSPRFIDPFRARAIVRRLPPFITPVGLFVNQPREYICGVASLVRLGAVQLHGDETLEFAASIDWPVIRAVSVDRAGAWPMETTLLLDAHDPVRRGGTGQTIDWRAAAAIAATRRVLLAGGLN